MNLQTKYLGLELKSPIVVSANPLSEKVDNILAMEEAGAGAVVMFSLFEEQIRREEAAYEYIYQQSTYGSAEAQDYFPDISDFHVGIDDYLRIIQESSRQARIPIIGSLNGISRSGWIDYAKQIEAAGASALEINIYYIPANPQMDGVEVEERYLDIVELVKEVIQIPVAIKLNPYFSALANMAQKLDNAGADGLVLFNRFYEPDFDIETMSLSHALELSSPSEIRLPLLWLAILHGRVGCSLAASTGVSSSKEVIKYLLAGADCAMTASAILKHGIPFIKHMIDEIKTWMAARNFDSVDQWKGKMSQKHMKDPTLYERANYIKVLEEYSVPTLTK
ncbi:MAG: dihydroorotate dehydrogenase-like protein [Saprospiraceae bacterium]|nr:dihydroorotate dehydrogenase-like protein [Saprospiraceae bacterium]